MKRPLLLILIVACLSAILVVFAYYGFPVPTGDSVGYIVPGINVAAGRGLISQMEGTSFMVNPGTAGKFNYYTPFMQLVMGHLLWRADGPTALIFVALLNSIAIALSAAAFWKVVRKLPLKSQASGAWLAALSTLGLATLMMYHHLGRSDIMTTLIAAAALLLVCSWPARRLAIPLGLCLGLMGATHPMGALFFGGLISMYASAEMDPPLRSLAILYVVSAVTFVAVMQWSPYSIAETIKAIHYQAPNALAKVQTFNVHEFLTYYFFNTAATFYGLVLFSALALVIRAVYRRSVLIQSPPAFYLFALLFLGLFYYDAIRNPLRGHDVFMFAPLYFALMIYWIPLLGLSWIRKTLTVFIALTTLGLVRCLVLFPYYLRDGVSMQTARALASNIIDHDPPGTRYEITSGLWVLYDNFDRLSLRDRDQWGAHGTILIQQYYFYDTPPVEPYPGYHRVWDNYVYKRPMLWGIPLAKRMPGYSFALYRRS